MLKIKEAVRRAHDCLPEIFENVAGKELLLEGVELTDDAKFWNITFSYGTKPEREYKTIKLRSKDGKVFGARNGFLLQ